jgi:hypothetical protein
MTKKFKREEIYELVWTQPTRTVAAGIGVSDVALAKACRKADVPIPPRGYWARKPGRRSPVRIALPPRFPGASEEIEFGARPYGSWNSDWRREMLEAPVPPVPVFEESMEAVAARAEKLVGKVPSQQTFDKAFGDISRLLAHDEERRKNSWSYDMPRYEKGIERRRLLLLNSIFLAVHALGCKAGMSTSKYQLDDPQYRGISIRVGDQHIGFTLEPPEAKGRHISRSAESMALRLSLKSSHVSSFPQKLWEDTKGRKLESQLREVVVAILITVEHHHRAGAVRHREWVIERKAEIQQQIAEENAERERRQRELQEQREQERIETLLGQAANLQKAQTIRNYVQTICERSSELVVSEEKLKLWAAWALGVADRIDPAKSVAFLNPAAPTCEDGAGGGPETIARTDAEQEWLEE